MPKNLISPISINHQNDALKKSGFSVRCAAILRSFAENNNLYISVFNTKPNFSLLLDTAPTEEPFRFATKPISIKTKSQPDGLFSGFFIKKAKVKKTTYQLHRDYSQLLETVYDIIYLSPSMITKLKNRKLITIIAKDDDESITIEDDRKNLYYLKWVDKEKKYQVYDFDGTTKILMLYKASGAAQFIPVFTDLDITEITCCQENNDPKIFGLKSNKFNELLISKSLRESQGTLRETLYQFCIANGLSEEDEDYQLIQKAITSIRGINSFRELLLLYRLNEITTAELGAQLVQHGTDEHNPNGPREQKNILFFAPDGSISYTKDERSSIQYKKSVIQSRLISPNTTPPSLTIESAERNPSFSSLETKLLLGVQKSFAEYSEQTTLPHRPRLFTQTSELLRTRDLHLLSLDPKRQQLLRKYLL